MGQQDGSFAHLGEHLKAVMQERGITVEKLAGITGLSLGLIVHLLAGEQILTADHEKSILTPSPCTRLYHLYNLEITQKVLT